MRFTVIICALLLQACSHTGYYAMTGHSKQADVIEASLQQALEHNPDGSSTYWADKSTGKSGYVMPVYEAHMHKSPCRHFELGYYFPDDSAEFYYGVACRQNQVWSIY